MFGIFYKNLILTILTLGIYRFWAKTRSAASSGPAPTSTARAFEYTGTGKELFLGFLKAVVVLVPVFAALQIVAAFVLGEGIELGTRFSVLQAFADRRAGLCRHVRGPPLSHEPHHLARNPASAGRLDLAYAAGAARTVLCAITLGFYFPILQTR